MTASCVVCECPVPDQGYVCHDEMRKARGRLAAIVDLTPAALDVAGRQTSSGLGGGDGKPGSSLPIDLAATARLDAVRNALGTWVRHVVETRGIYPAPTPAGFDVIAPSARFLAEHLEWFRHQPEVPEFLDDVRAAIRVVARITNRREPGRYAGPCSAEVDGKECGQDVEARAGSDMGKCRACGAEYDVDEQQAWMRGEIEGWLARPVEIAGVLLRLGFKVGYSTIAAYAAKGQLVARGSDEDGRPLYRIGDVMDLRLGAQQRRLLARGAAQS